MEYRPNIETRLCGDLDCEETEACLCSLCLCCTVCVAKCSCAVAQTDPDKKLAELLGFGDANYGYLIKQKLVLSSFLINLCLEMQLSSIDSKKDLIVILPTTVMKLKSRTLKIKNEMCAYLVFSNCKLDQRII